jgi:hypothetical protein
MTDANAAAYDDALVRFGPLDHDRDDPECSYCWRGYPRPCACGGLVHAQFGDENWDGDYWLDRACDRCGGHYDEVEAG